MKARVIALGCVFLLLSKAAAAQPAATIQRFARAPRGSAACRVMTCESSSSSRATPICGSRWLGFFSRHRRNRR